MLTFLDYVPQDVLDLIRACHMPQHWTSARLSELDPLLSHIPSAILDTTTSRPLAKPGDYLLVSYSDGTLAYGQYTPPSIAQLMIDISGYPYATGADLPIPPDAKVTPLTTWVAPNKNYSLQTLRR